MCGRDFKLPCASRFGDVSGVFVAALKEPVQALRNNQTPRQHLLHDRGQTSDLRPQTRAVCQLILQRIVNMLSAGKYFNAHPALSKLRFFWERIFLFRIATLPFATSDPCSRLGQHVPAVVHVPQPTASSLRKRLCEVSRVFATVSVVQRSTAPVFFAISTM